MNASRPPAGSRIPPDASVSIYFARRMNASRFFASHAAVVAKKILLSCIIVVGAAFTAMHAAALPLAPGQVSLRIDTKGTSCPDLAAQVQLEVQAHSKQIAFVAPTAPTTQVPARRVHLVTGEASAAGASASVVIEGEPRTLEAETCLALGNAIAFVLLVAFDPDAARLTREHSNADRADAHRPIEIRAPAPRAGTITRAIEHDAKVARPMPLQTYLGGGGLLLASPLPSPSLGAAVWFGVGRPQAWEVRTELAWASTRVLDQKAQAVFDLATLALDVCPWAIGGLSALTLHPCAGASAGVLRGDGQATEITRENLSFWADMRASVRLKVRLGGWAVVPVAGALVPLVRPTYVFDKPRIEVHAVPALAAFLSIGAERRFP
jgi:hypothetical protein